MMIMFFVKDAKIGLGVARKKEEREEKEERDIGTKDVRVVACYFGLSLKKLTDYGRPP
jgi:hypothetical protein